MVARRPRVVKIFVDKSCPDRWVVRDTDGNFWIVPPSANPWDDREPYSPANENDLEPVPGHYSYVLGLPT
jgi:hypothetical protein